MAHKVSNPPQAGRGCYICVRLTCFSGRAYFSVGFDMMKKYEGNTGMFHKLGHYTEFWYANLVIVSSHV